MSNANEPAFPGSYTSNNGMPVWSGGMTKLEYAAIQVMQGMVCNSRRASHDVAIDAVNRARALLAELEKEVRA
jgi:hypothetical protein